MQFIVVREYRPQDLPVIIEIVRNAYISNIFMAWRTVVFSEITFQLVTMVSAFMFIFMGVPLLYCVLSFPLVLLALYIIIYGSILIKSAELFHSKKHLQCWVAEAVEPCYFMDNPELATYTILPENDTNVDGFEVKNMKRKIVGTVAVMKHNIDEDCAWLFRLAVDKSYRRKGVGIRMTRMAQFWCRTNNYNSVELALTDCQDGARQLFSQAGFLVSQMYHKRLFTSAFTLQMYQLKSELRSTFR